MKSRWFIIFGVLFIAVSANGAMAWGPATHIELANQLLAEAGVLGSALMALLLKNSRHFLYGNIAADIVFAKKFSKVKHSCHKWSMAQNLQDAARTDEQKAFAFGYMTHLAADVVAHNKYIPRQLLLTRTSSNLGHLLWELRADTQVQRANWPQLQQTLLQPFPQHEELLEQHLEDTFFSFDTNLRIFNRMNLLASAKRWRGLVDRWGRMSRLPLEAALITNYHAESLALMRLALRRMDDPILSGSDPSGTVSLQKVRQNRKFLRQLTRQGFNSDLLAEAMSDVYAPDASLIMRRSSVA